MLRNLAKLALRQTAAAAGPHRWPRREAALWVVTYHRILPPDDPRYAREEPGMVVTPETFRRHLRWLAKRFDIVSLSDWLLDAENGRKRPRRACAVTFDDGWRDNHEFALPELVETRTPATVFLVSDLIGTRRLFWPNRLARLLVHLGAAAPQHESLGWIRELGAMPERFDGGREQISGIIAACKRLSDRKLQEALKLGEQAAGLPPTEKPELLDWNEVAEMRETGLVELGSHTCTHMRLNASAPAEDVRREIVESREQLERQVGLPVRLFCYPNGDSSAAARRLVEAHYAGAVTTRRGMNSPSTPAHALMRIGVHEDVASTERDFVARLSGWV